MTRLPRPADDSFLGLAYGEGELVALLLAVASVFIGSPLLFDLAVNLCLFKV